MYELCEKKLILTKKGMSGFPYLPKGRHNFFKINFLQILTFYQVTWCRNLSWELNVWCYEYCAFLVRFTAPGLRDLNIFKILRDHQKQLVPKTWKEWSWILTFKLCMHVWCAISFARINFITLKRDALCSLRLGSSLNWLHVLTKYAAFWSLQNRRSSPKSAFGAGYMNPYSHALKPIYGKTWVEQTKLFLHPFHIYENQYL